MTPQERKAGATHWTRRPHHCTKCEYLGSGSVEGEQVDWYLHQYDAGRYSAIGRFGEEEHEYWSAPNSVLRSMSDNGSTFASAFLACIRNRKGVWNDAK